MPALSLPTKNSDDLLRALLHEHQAGRLSPASLAVRLTQGKFRLPRHLEILNGIMMDAAAGDGGRYIVTMPPRHGKSELCSHWTSAWFLGTYPDRRVMLASYGAALAEGFGRLARDSFAEACALGVWPGLQIDQRSSAANEWHVKGHAGGMVTAGVGGPLTGRGGDLVLVDDPFKDYQEACSPVMRERVWDWYKTVLRTRLEPGGSIVVIQTRWHPQDLAGRLLARAQDEADQDEDAAEQWELTRFPAIAEADDPLGREEGEALWPERYDRAAILQAMGELSPHQAAALYQQRPTAREGGMFKEAWFTRFCRLEDLPRGLRLVRVWDLAATEGGGDWTVGMLMGEMGGTYFVVDVVRGQWGPLGVETKCKTTAAEDAKEWGDVTQAFYQDPGQAGKSQAVHIRRWLAGHRVRIISTAGPELRAERFAARCEAGDVVLVEAAWTPTLIEELAGYAGKEANGVDDQVDTAGGGRDILDPARQAKAIQKPQGL